MKKVMKKSLCALLALAMVATGLVLPGTEARAEDYEVQITQRPEAVTMEYGQKNVFIEGKLQNVGTQDVKIGPGNITTNSDVFVMNSSILTNGLTLLAGSDAQDFQIRVKSDTGIGTYKATLTVPYTNADGTIQKELTMNLSATVNRKKVVVTEPQAKVNLKYTGYEEDVVDSSTGQVRKASSVTFDPNITAHIKYCLDEDFVNCSTNFFELTNAGTYTVYWKVYTSIEGNFDLLDFGSYKTSGQFSVTIAPANATVNGPTAKTGLKYTGEAQELVDAGSITSSDVTNTNYLPKIVYSLEPEGKYEETVPTGKEAGTYTVYWKVDDESENFKYTGNTSGNVPVTISKADSDVTPTETDMTVTYGDPVTLTVGVKRQGAGTIALAAAQDHVTFSTGKGGELDATVEYNSEDNNSGKATVTIEKEQVKNYFNIGNNTVNVSYGGSINLENNEDATITVNLSKKPLNFTFEATNREYNGETTVEGELSKPELVGTDDVTATAKATVESADVGNGKNVNVTVTLEGDDKDYYEAVNPAGVTVDISKADASVTKDPVGNTLDYNGGEQELITAGTATGGTMKYILSDAKPNTSSGDWKTDAAEIKGQEAKTYTIWYYVEGDENHNSTEPESVTATISKAASEVTKAPTANELTYTGSEQELVTKGTANGGTMQYALSEDENQPAETSFTGNIPMGTEAKTYYVWYKVKGDKDHEDTTPVKVTAEIKKAASNVTVAVDKETHTYGDEITLTANIAVSGVETSLVNGQVTFKAGTAELGTATAANGTATVTIQSTDGTNQKALFDNSTQVTAEYSGNDNINTSTSVAKSVTVKQKELTFKFNAEGKTYNNDTTVNGEFEALTGQLLPGDVVTVNTYTAKTDNPNVGTEKTVTVEVTELGGDAAKYYTPGAATSNNIEITKAESSMSGPTGKNDLVYDGKDQELIQTAGEATGGSMMYYVGEAAPGTDDGGWKGAIADIKGKDAGTYTVWYYVEGDGNHNNTEAQSITVEIAKKEVGLEWHDYDNLTYTGKPQNVTATAKTDVEGETVNVTVTGGDQTDAGSYEAKATKLTNGTGKADNYKLPEDVTKEYTIKKLPCHSR